MQQPKKPRSISRAFNDASRHPAWKFQRLNNLRGIAGAYKIPEGMTASGYEDITMRRLMEDKDLQRRAGARNSREMVALRMRGGFWAALSTAPAPKVLQDSWDALVELNPELSQVKVEREKIRSLLDAHYGVTSGFNIDDINFFQEQKKVGEGLPGLQSRNMPVHGERLDRIEAAASSQMFWVVSPKTAKKIEQRFKRRGLL